MQISHLSVEELFESFTHEIAFPAAEKGHSLVILHGQNGVGKTTVLRMLEGALRTDFNVFRSVPFRRCELVFSTGQRLVVTPSEVRPPHALTVEYGDGQVILHPSHPGPREETEDATQAVENWRQQFMKDVSSIQFSLIEATRLLNRYVPDDPNEATMWRYDVAAGIPMYATHATSERKGERRTSTHQPC